jgi:hypothetical protein
MRAFALLVAVALLTGCATTVQLSDAIAPAPAGLARSPEAAGVVCSPELLARVERARFHKFALGEPLCSALAKSVEATYRSAQRVEKPYKGQYGRVVQFYLQDSALDVGRTPDGSLRAVYSVRVAVETRGRDLRPSTRKLVTGMAVVARRDVKTAELVKETAEAALQQLADNTARLLVAGLDGPRVRGSASASEP